MHGRRMRPGISGTDCLRRKVRRSEDLWIRGGTMICPCCGREFRAKGNEKYCESCRHRILDEYTKWRRMKTRKKLKKCIICGRPMEHYTSPYVCSRECGNIAKNILNTEKKRLSRQANKQWKEKMCYGNGDEKPVPRRKLKKPLSPLGLDIEQAKLHHMDYPTWMNSKERKEWKAQCT